MRVFVTGSRGFLGRHLVPFLQSQAIEVDNPSRKELDLMDFDALQSYSQKKYDRIYHLAAWTQAGDFCLRYPGDQWVNNQILNTNVLKWWSELQPQARLIFMGTSCSYSPELPLVESNYMKGQPIDSLYTYAMTKRMLLVGAQSLSKQYDLTYNCFIPSTLYGGNYHSDGRQMHFIFDLIRKIVSASKTGSKAVLWGDGNQRRELVHVKDFVSIMEFLIPKLNNDLINIGAGIDYSIKEFANTICELTKTTTKVVEYDKTKYVGAKSKCLNIDKLQYIYPQLEYLPLRTGLNDSIAWYLTTQD
ncbi:NAD-dependent epimerase/dehydratase family protein [Prochlorococcus sp. MIT 1300]|uniref:NAD-dependent epimerase/dehydratase family protein n=1 Tax=Prochlorococcus sp. MIT 1300 TaxID=3096218 RepID=UPI002A748926|nr:NAD-dependent epimerase/dehydratase family protein [Prochlorococcus sp. MIT 1300]